MTVTQRAAARLAEMMKNEGAGEKHVRLQLDGVT